MNDRTARELTLTFDVEGNWQMPAAIDFSEQELDVLADTIAAVTNRRATA